KNAGVVGLPVSVVALADHSVSQCIEGPRSSAAGSFVKIPRILFEDRGQYGVADHVGEEKVSVGGGVTLGVARCVLSVAAEIIIRLLNPRCDSSCCEGDWIEVGLPGELELLLRGERRWVGDVAD